MRMVRLVMIVSLLGASLAAAGVARADVQRTTSMPNGDIFVLSSSGTSTNKDKDGNFSSLTQSETLGLTYAVFNQAETAQTVHVTVVLDGPGTQRDAVLVDDDFDLGRSCPQDGSLCTDSQQGRFEFQIKRKSWPEGNYSLSVTGSGTESATAVSTFSVTY